MKRTLTRSALVLAVLVAISASWCVVYTKALPNLLSLLTSDGFFIPPESSIFSFRSTVDNPGSGDWWIYAEDNRYYYAMPDHETLRYIAFPKSKVHEIIGFQAKDYQSWPQSDSIVGSVRIK